MIVSKTQNSADSADKYYFHKVSIERLLGKEGETGVSSALSALTVFNIWVQTVQMNGCFHKVSIEKLLGKEGETGGACALGALMH